MKPNMTAAQLGKRVGKRGSPLPIRHMRAAVPRRINKTAKRSVTRMRRDQMNNEKGKKSLPKPPN